MAIGELPVVIKGQLASGLACKMMSIGWIIRHSVVGEAQMTATPILSNSCDLTKIKVSDSKVYDLVGPRNLRDSILLLITKLTSRPKLIVRHIYMSVFTLDMKKDKFASTS